MKMLLCSRTIYQLRKSLQLATLSLDLKVLASEMDLDESCINRKDFNN
jgi:hypothetical protein